MELTINSSMYRYLKGVIAKYFRSEHRWRYDEDEGELRYYKGKRNLKELEFIADMVFGDISDVVQKGYYYNTDGECTGAYIVIHLYVDADFNGANQGTAGDYSYLIVSLFENTFSLNQSTGLADLVDKECMEEVK
ncbi:hypothetical protein [Bacillus sp. NEAU-Y102]